MKIVLIILGVSFSMQTFAQSLGPTSKDPENRGQKEFSTRSKHAKAKNYNLNDEFDRLVLEYEQRMKNNIKKYKKLSRKMKKPQYSDPLYFGHKRKPKKRKLGKRKFCKECSIVH